MEKMHVKTYHKRGQKTKMGKTEKRSKKQQYAGQ